jgi:hypothetical protein
LFLLLWVGFDLGAHGLFASDFTPITLGGSSLCLSADDGSSTASVVSDHCFCHSTSMGAVVPARPASLMPVGAVAVDFSLQVPHGAPHPLDRPPQPTA